MFRDPPDWLRDATDPAMAWDVGGSRPLWANGPALALWGDRTLPEFLSRRFEPDDTFAAAVRTAAAAPAAAAAAIVFAPRGRPLRAELSVRPISARAGAPAAEAVAVILRPSAPSAPETRAARAEALFETAPSALAQLAADGRVLRENAAARRLFGPARAEGFAERFRDARAVGDAMTAAALHGAFEHGAVAASDGGRLRVVYRRFDDPVAQAETLVAHAAPAPMAETVAAEPTLDALTAGAALFDAGTLRLVSANAAARGWWAPKPAEAGADGAADATLFSLAPRAAPEIAAALAALKANPAAAPSFDVRPRAPSAPFAPTPWLRATLTLARLGGRRMLVATLQDLGPERRAIARLRLDADQRAAALAALGGGAAVIDADGRLLALDPAARAALGLGAGDGAPTLQDALAPPDKARLTAYLADGPIVAGVDFSAGAEVRTGRAGAIGRARLALSAPSRAGDGRRAAAILAAPAAPSAAGASGAEAGPGSALGAPGVDALLEAAERARAAHALRDELNALGGLIEIAARRGRAEADELEAMLAAARRAAAVVAEQPGHAAALAAGSRWFALAPAAAAAAAAAPAGLLATASVAPPLQGARALGREEALLEAVGAALAALAAAGAARAALSLEASAGGGVRLRIAAPQSAIDAASRGAPGRLTALLAERAGAALAQPAPSDAGAGALDLAFPPEAVIAR